MARGSTKGTAGSKAVRAAFADAKSELAREGAVFDPPPQEKRLIEVAGKAQEVAAGQWSGAPVDQLPPECPVIPLGREGKTSYFVDSEGQIKAVSASEWGKRAVNDLFARQPNYPEWAWPKWVAGRGDQPPHISGLAADVAEKCLIKAAADRGFFSPADRVRGRGAWTDDYGRLIWHAGDYLCLVEDGRLRVSKPGALGEHFYARQAVTIAPWPEPVPVDESPAQGLFRMLKSWNWERPEVDPLVVLGSLGVLMIGGALHVRPNVFVAGGFGVGKSALQDLVKSVLRNVLHDTANASEAGIRQRLALDTLPIAVDQMEAASDNRRAIGVMELARIAYSGGRFFRGGADHKGVEFIARSAFFMSGIVPPPMESEDKSRFAMLNLDKLGNVGEPPVVSEEAGRKLLRSVMDGWSRWAQTLADMTAQLRQVGFSRRQADTYGTLLGMSLLMLGTAAFEDGGLPITEGDHFGEIMRKATIEERDVQVENWRACLEHLLGSVIDAWRGGEKPSVGSVLDQLESEDMSLSAARDRLGTAGLGLQEEEIEGQFGKRRHLLAVPRSSPALGRLFAGTRWQDGGWWASLRQGASCGVVSDIGKVVKINRVPARCALVDLKRYDAFVSD